ncbi:hypothetical protein M9H77_08942 [Catharanthus roseus]|uniref:Uncharacterized protein n=1 Tax=Catharanthus roseus TaxID=4058 RepID=A0ACC0BZ54_CATRO|nr:hypothetical protein M9H77_08942 [Catharanthus roseus]
MLVNTRVRLPVYSLFQAALMLVSGLILQRVNAKGQVSRPNTHPVREHMKIAQDGKRLLDSQVAGKNLARLLIERQNKGEETGRASCDNEENKGSSFLIQFLQVTIPRVPRLLRLLLLPKFTSLAVSKWKMKAVRMEDKKAILVLRMFSCGLLQITIKISSKRFSFRFKMQKSFLKMLICPLLASKRDEDFESFLLMWFEDWEETL